MFILKRNRREENAVGEYYYSFWTDTFLYMNESFLLMLDNGSDYDELRLRYGDTYGNFVYNAECSAVCRDDAIGGGGIASSKNKKNKKAASPRTLPLATSERSSRTQLSFGSPRERKYRLLGSHSSTASSPQLRRPRRANH